MFLSCYPRPAFVLSCAAFLSGPSAPSASVRKQNILENISDFILFLWHPRRGTVYVRGVQFEQVQEFKRVRSVVLE